ncbi:alpha/beta fold hydrolase [Microbulbifer sp. TYP-18]|uniref:alpha/beta fold hydrolase n=1 Tax=Microbulbifer sp. TYP-18 TaxID=3230024 RepID=UPI0034C663B6
MNVSHFRDPGIIEYCPVALTKDRLFCPSEAQLEMLFSRTADGRLNPSLRDDSQVKWGDPVGTVASAAIFRLLETGDATAPPGFGGAGSPVISIAIADLSVTGATNLARFRSAAIGEGGEVDLPRLKGGVALVARAYAEDKGVTILPGRSRQVFDAAEYVVDRALAVLWALHGPVAHRAAARQPLGWIAVNAERDPPPRPVNVDTINWPCADIDVTVGHDGRDITTRIRYAIAGAADADTDVSISDSLPETRRPPLIPDDCLLLVFLHGHSSRLEEAGSFYQGLLDEQEFSAFSKPFAVVSFDFPTNGYSDYVDHEDLSPLQTTTRYSPDRPEQRRFGMLEYYEKLVVEFVEELDRQIIADGRSGILDRIAAVVGGSMGGNLALRLSERLVTNASWLDALVSWSPASSYVSFGRADYFIPSPGEHFDAIAKEALERPHHRCQQRESNGSRADFIGLQIQGERLLNDGTPGFEAGVRLLSFFAQPLVGGLAPLILGPGLGPLVSGLVGPQIWGAVAVEGVANITPIKQSDTWLREECRAEYDNAAAGQSALLLLNETYNSRRRRMHWRIAYEQLLFSHQDEVAASRGLPCYQASDIPTLLIAGAEDVVDEHRFNIFGGVQYLAPRMENNPGYAILVDETGHSIHAERPRWLAQRILSFIAQRRPPREILSASREDGRITAFHFAPLWKPKSYEQVLNHALARGGVTPYVIVDELGNRTRVLARRYLATQADDNPDNNLRALPPTSLVEPEGTARGRDGGFPVTHIRIRESSDSPAGSWVSHLCNDALNLQVSNYHAEEEVVAGRARYYILADGTEVDLHIVEYLTTNPDGIQENNLSELPDAAATDT